MRIAVLAMLLGLANCQAWGDLTTGAMNTTNSVAGTPPPARQP